MLKMLRLILIMLVCSYLHVTYADNALLQRQDVKNFINEMVQTHHFDKQQLVNIFNEAQFQPQIIQSMDRPYEKKTWDVYKNLFLTSERVQAGLNFWRENKQTLQKAEQQYNVPANIIVAIIGVETLYGKHQGNYRVLDSLTTLAFHYPKRAEFFTKELKEFLLLCREHGVPATKYMGSYAGAMGKPQFMPSSYRFYAVDFAGHGHSDLMNEDKDVIGSVANYFHRHGWIRDQSVVQPVQVAGSRYKNLATNSRAPDYNVTQLLNFGVKPLSQLEVKPPIKAGLIELYTDKGQEYWLAYPNFYVITHYNTSPQYALVVYLLAQQLQEQWAMSNHSRIG